MNLFLALFWLACAVVLVAYEHYIGGRSRIRVGNLSFSRTWLMVAATLMVAAYNLWRWRRVRASRLRQRLLEIDRAKREWEMRRRYSEPVRPPDPNFNFTNEPPHNPNVSDRPPTSP